MSCNYTYTLYLDARDLLLKSGWLQCDWEDPGGACCPVRALARVLGLPVDRLPAVVEEVLQAVLMRRSGYRMVWDGLELGEQNVTNALVEWNDTPGRRLDDVIGVLHDAAELTGWVPHPGTPASTDRAEAIAQAAKSFDDELTALLDAEEALSGIRA